MNKNLVALAAALASGIVFGFGLAIARMTDPQKVKDFLDIASIPDGGWDPSLAFVMGAALIVAFFGLRANRVMATPLAAPAFIQSRRAAIDPPLVIGAALFGVGWGLAGFCPGPSIADLGIIPGDVYLFVGAMFLSSWVAGALMDMTPAMPLAGAADAAGE